MKGNYSWKETTEKKYDELLLEVRRVTRVTTWWRRLSFRAIVLVWDRKWKIWLWISKSQDVTWALKKAIHDAYKNIVEVPLIWADTVPYPITYKYKSAIIKLLPAAAGTWLKAWSSVRMVLELAWYLNILSKIIWTNNKLNNAIATIKALTNYKELTKHVKKKSVDEEQVVKTSSSIEIPDENEDNAKKETVIPNVAKKTTKKTTTKKTTKTTKSTKTTKKTSK